VSTNDTDGGRRTVDVVDATGAKTGSAELPAELFDVTANIPLIHQVVVAQLAAARQGTHSTKTRGEVRGGGRKPYRQKGTGRARQGSTRSPQWAGGGIAHGPQPHGYAQRTPKKMIAAALRGALSDRARDNRVYVVSDLVGGDVPSTKTALAALAGVTTTEKVLVVIHRDEDIAWLSLRNVPSVHAIAVDQLNAYDVLVNDEVVFTSTAFDAYVSGPSAGKSAKAVARSAEVEVDEPSNDAASTVQDLVEPSVDEPGVDEPSNDELAASAVEESVEPSNEELSATAATASSIVEVPAAEAPTEPETVAAEPESVVVEPPAADTYTEGKYGAGSYQGAEPPTGFDIKGNEDSMLYHTPDSPSYGQTVAEVWFSSAEAAEVAGFAEANSGAVDEEEDSP
jgi:large subunit ribosomal protein L4